MNKENIVIDKYLHIDKETVCTYIDKNVQITSPIIIKGTLKFINCVIELSNGKIIVEGKLEIQSCKIIGIEKEFLNLLPKSTTYLQNTEFIFNSILTETAIIAEDAEAFVAEDCVFQEVSFLLSMKTSSRGVFPLMNVENGAFQRCTFKNFVNFNIGTRVVILKCVFDNCQLIQIGNLTEPSDVRECLFKDCNKLNLFNVEVDWTEFNNIQKVHLESSYISICTFKNIKSSQNAIWSKNTNITYCEFENILLTNNSCLIETVGDCWIWDNTFTDCKASNLVHHNT